MEGGRAGSPPVGRRHITDGTKGGEGGEAYDSLGSVIRFKKQKVKAEEEDGIRHQTAACIKGPWYLATFLWTRHQNFLPNKSPPPRFFCILALFKQNSRNKPDQNLFPRSAPLESRQSDQRNLLRSCAMCTSVTRGTGACPVRHDGGHCAMSNQSRHKFWRDS
jgi:hypothetical protein